MTVFALVLFFCNSSAAFDFRAVCIGCPEDGTPEAESAHTVAQYVVSFLINIQAAQKVRGDSPLVSVKNYQLWWFSLHPHNSRPERW